MRTADIAKRYLDYFAKHDHLIVPSASLISPNPTTLFTIAGMVPFIPYLMGEQTPPKRRMASNQKCVRTLDIDEVGKTTRHGTFFQMLGNFSFGDYFKEEAIHYAWELLTTSQDEGGYGFDPEKLWMTTFTDDDEARSMWINEGVDPEHIQKMGMEDNFWTTGGPGPGGPCSEIYVDRGPAFGKEGGPIADENRYIEIWDLVFENYEVDNVKSKTDLHIVGELENKNIDTGAGLERLAYLLQGKNNIYETDEVFPVIEAAEQLSGLKYGENEDADVRFRVVADHVRSALMIMSDGVRPSNVGRGYVLRRLLRRTVRSMRMLGVTDPVLPTLFPTSKAAMEASYPELNDTFHEVSESAYGEEDAFRRTLETGTTILDVAVNKAKSDSAEPVVAGEDAFKLYDTYGFPIDLTREMAVDEGLSVDEEAFAKAMAEQKTRAREARKALGDLGWAGVEFGKDIPSTEFVGYDHDSVDDAKVVALVVEGEQAEAMMSGVEGIIVLDKTPFYAEMGGQIGDTGVIRCGEAVFEVTDVQKNKGDKFMHTGKVIHGSFQLGDTVTASIDVERRMAIRRGHTATHLLDAALKAVLGDHVHQAGSLVEPDRLRFDFTHFESITPEQLLAVDTFVNDAILRGIPVVTEVLPIEEAKKKGAVAMFGEKYGDVVRVVEMGDVSMEFCGGTHLDNTAKVGLFRIKSEGSVASGVRRIEAITGKQTLEELRSGQEKLMRATQLLKTTSNELESRIGGMLSEMKEIRSQLEKFKEQASLGEARSFLTSAKEVKSLKLVTAQRDGMDANALRKLGDFLRDKEPKIVGVLASVNDGKVTLLAVCGKEAVASGIKAGDIIKAIAPICGGKGGGKPDSAMGGGTEVSKVDDALAAVDDLILSKLG